MRSLQLGLGQCRGIAACMGLCLGCGRHPPTGTGTALQITARLPHMPRSSPHMCHFALRCARRQPRFSVAKPQHSVSFREPARLHAAPPRPRTRLSQELKKRSHPAVSATFRRLRASPPPPPIAYARAFVLGFELGVPRSILRHSSTYGGVGLCARPRAHDSVQVWKGGNKRVPLWND